MSVERSSDDEAPEVLSFTAGRAKSTEELKRRTRAQARRKKVEEVVEEPSEALNVGTEDEEEVEDSADEGVDSGEAIEAGDDEGDSNEESEEDDEEEDEGVEYKEGDEEDGQLGNGGDDPDVDDDMETDDEEEEEEEDDDGSGGEDGKGDGNIYFVDRKGKKKAVKRLKVMGRSSQAVVLQPYNLQHKALAFRRQHMFGGQIRRANEDVVRSRKLRRPATVFRKGANRR